MHILALFFAVDGSHSKKRILAFNKNVEKLTIVSYYRNNNVKYDNHHNLGQSPQKHYLRRFIKIIFDVPRLRNILSINPDVQVVYAWNFDIALLFRLVRMFSKRNYTFIYEVADIKQILLSESLVGKVLRKLEQVILSKTDFLCVTSQAFINNYFNKYYHFTGRTHILENKVFPPINNINSQNVIISKDRKKWRIGFIGLIRCTRSLQLLHDLANTLSDKIEIVLAGRPEEFAKDSYAILSGLKNVKNFGTYKYPDDLPKVYAQIDIIWSADFSDPSINSKWLLPNRIYEAGIFSVPQLCFPENEATCKYINSLNIGWMLDDSNLESVLIFFNTLTNEHYQKVVSNYNNLPSNQFSGDDQIKSLINKVKTN